MYLPISRPPTARALNLGADNGRSRIAPITEDHDHVYLLSRQLVDNECSCMFIPLVCSSNPTFEVHLLRWVHWMNVLKLKVEHRSY